MCKSDVEYNCNLIYFITNDVIRKAGDKDFADEIEKTLAAFLSAQS